MSLKYSNLNQNPKRHKALLSYWLFIIKFVLFGCYYLEVPIRWIRGKKNQNPFKHNSVERIVWVIESLDKNIVHI
jgi:hypothetical protein